MLFLGGSFVSSAIGIVPEVPDRFPGRWLFEDVAYTQAIPVATPLYMLGGLVAIWSIGLWLRSDTRPELLVASAVAVLIVDALQLYLMWTIFTDVVTHRFFGATRALILGGLALVLLASALVAWWRQRSGEAVAPAVAASP